MMLDRKITIQQATVTRGAGGEEIHGWSTYATRWAGIEYVGGSETVENDRLLANTTVKFTIRYDNRIHKGMQVIYKHYCYNITHIIEEGRQQWLHLFCETTDTEYPFTIDADTIKIDSTYYTADQITW